VTASPYLLVDEVAARLRCSTRTVHELTRSNAIPHRKLPGARRCLFLPAELEAWEAGAPLELVELPRGGRVVRTKAAR
jgi:excisionase family DNA binding protein